MVDPKTEESITAGELRPGFPNVWNCGCEHRRVRVIPVEGEPTYKWFLCPFHDGFDMGVDAMRAVMEMEQ